MNSNSVKDNLGLLTINGIIILVVIFVINSNSSFSLAHGTPSSPSSTDPSFSKSIEQTRQELHSSINNQVQQIFTDTIKNINKNTDVTNSSSIVNNTNSIRNSELSPSNSTEITKKVRVGDIEIAYKMFGKGEPLLLISGFWMTKDGWDPIVLDKLSLNHSIIVFDNRGVGNTSLGNNTASILQFVNDTAGFLDAIGIKKPVDVLGLSFGGYIAQELALLYPEKISHLIVYASSCGGKESLPPQVNREVGMSIISGNADADMLGSTLFPKEWIKEHPDFIQRNLSSDMAQVSKQSLQHHYTAISNWSGTCDRISTITNPTLIITGTEDVTSPPANALLLAEKIPGAWLVQIENGGHGVMYQYPEKVANVIETFFSANRIK